MNHRIIAIAAATINVIMLSGAAMGKEPDPLAGLSCEKLQWGSWEDVTERGFISVDVEINGVKRTLQFDTGADVSIAYGPDDHWPSLNFNPASNPKGPPSDHMNFSVAGVDLGKRRIFFNKDVKAAPGDDGTLGLSALYGAVLAIDFPNQRFCVAKAEDFPKKLAARTRFIGASVEHNKLWVPITVNGERYEHFFYDSGASYFPLFVDYKLWRALTGKNSGDEASQVINGNHMGDTWSFRGASAIGDMEIGPVVVEKPEVFYRSNGLTWFAGWKSFLGYEANGSFGNEPFLDRIIILDLTEKAPRFGIVE